MELKSEIKIPYQGINSNLKEIIEYLVRNKRSELYRLPEGEVEGVDFRQDVIVNLVRQFENAAYQKLLLEFPQLTQERIRRETAIRDAGQDALRAFTNN